MLLTPAKGYATCALGCTTVNACDPWHARRVAYTVGARRIASLLETAQGALGASFSFAEFHDALLEHGAMPLEACCPASFCGCLFLLCSLSLLGRRLSFLDHALRSQMHAEAVLEWLAHKAALLPPARVRFALDGAAGADAAAQAAAVEGARTAAAVRGASAPDPVAEGRAAAAAAGDEVRSGAAAAAGERASGRGSRDDGMSQDERSREQPEASGRGGGGSGTSEWRPRASSNRRSASEEQIEGARASLDREDESAGGQQQAVAAAAAEVAAADEVAVARSDTGGSAGGSAASSADETEEAERRAARSNL